MGKIAFVFSGQGAQHAGMGQDFYNNSERVRKLFDSAEGLRKGTLDMCFSGSPEELKRTENTQPCLYLADMAAALAMDELGVKADGAAGFSLGEIPALAYAGSFSQTEGFMIACRRGEIMAEAAGKLKAEMAAVLKLEHGEVERLCKNYDRVFPVNYNSPGQLVVSGTPEELELFKADVTGAGGRIMKLPVGGGFHSPFMDEASIKFGEYLSSADLKRPRIITYSDCTAGTYGDNVRELLTRQINSPVRWDAIITDMAANGYDTFIETGVGNVLKKLIGRIAPDARTFSVETTGEARAAAEEIGNA